MPTDDYAALIERSAQSGAREHGRGLLVVVEGDGDPRLSYYTLVSVRRDPPPGLDFDDAQIWRWLEQYDLRKEYIMLLIVVDSDGIGATAQTLHMEYAVPRANAA